MGYLVATTGRLLLPPDLERQALTVAEHRMAARGGWFDPDRGHVDSLADLATYAGVTLTREGDWLSLSTDTQGDPKWSEQADEFYRSLSEFVHQGEVHLRGEDGSTWSYAYSPTGVEQRGRSGWGDDGGGRADEELDSPPPEPPRPPEPPGGTASPSSPSDAGQPPAAPAPPQPPQAPEPGYIDYPGKEDRPPPPPQPPSAPPGGGAHPSWGTPAEDDPPPASRGRVLAMTALLVVGVLLIIGLALVASGF